MAAVFLAVGDMNPAAVKLIDELVVRKVQRNDEVTQTPVVLLTVAHRANVGSLPEGVLRPARTAHGCVEPWTAEARSDDDGGAPCLAKGIEDMVDKTHQVVLLRRIGNVSDAKPPRRG